MKNVFKQDKEKNRTHSVSVKFNTIESINRHHTSCDIVPVDVRLPSFAIWIAKLSSI